MATGGGLGALIPVAMTLAGIVTLLRARSRRRSGAARPADEDFERRQVAAMEMERRMAAYLAGRSAGGWDAPLEDRKQETDR
ncbi:MAG: hypothetical protein ACLGIE_14400 [Alphaproteobacteria bacterium]